MENQFYSPALLQTSWPSSYVYHPKMQGLDELKNSLFYTAMELEAAKLTAQEELRRRDEELTHLRNLLAKTIRERNDAQEKCHKLNLENIFLLQNLSALPTLTTPVSAAEEDDPEPEPPQPHYYNKPAPLNNNRIIISTSSDNDESCTTTISSTTSPPPSSSAADHSYAMLLLPQNKPLPEKGKLLQAVMKAGPLLQTLMLAGPLPQWRHPPPPLKSFEIPPVGIGCGSPLPKGGCEDGCNIIRKYYHRSISSSSE